LQLLRQVQSRRDVGHAVPRVRLFLRGMPRRVRWHLPGTWCVDLLLVI
jgi:hypothetical protein